MTIVIASSNVLCPIGRGSEQAWASARTGIARIAESSLMDRNFEPIRMGLVPDETLGELSPDIDALPLPPRARRLLRLAAPTLQGLGVATSEPVALFLGLPQLAAEDVPWRNHFLRYLELLTSVPIDHERSAIVPHGRAAALMALERALAALAKDPTRPVIVGGVDTFFDLQLLGALDAEQRVLGSSVMDGFIPGEGAGFLLLESADVRAGDETRIVVNAAVSTSDPGHRYGTSPARGEGLADAIEQLRSKLGSTAPVATAFAGFNGESFDSKLWGVAHLRHRDFFSPSLTIEHPADKCGDLGAAMGAILMALAAAALADGSRAGPALVWAASDHEPRACALLCAAAS